jgi:hypothetical protein
MPLRITRSTATRSSSPISGRRSDAVLLRKATQAALVLGVLLSRHWTCPDSVPTSLQGMARLSDPPHLLGRHARNESEIQHILGYDRPSRDERPAADDDGGDAGGPGSDGGSVADRHPDRLPIICAFHLTVRCDGAGEGVIREDCGGADEDAILEQCGFVDESVVLHLAAVTHDNTRANVRTTADHTISAQDSPLTDLGEMPNRGALTNSGGIANVGTRMDADRHRRSVPSTRGDVRPLVSTAVSD